MNQLPNVPQANVGVPVVERSPLSWYTFGLRLSQAELFASEIPNLNKTPRHGIGCLTRLRDAVRPLGGPALLQGQLIRTLDILDSLYQELTSIGQMNWSALRSFEHNLSALNATVPRTLEPDDLNAFELGRKICLFAFRREGDEVVRTWRDVNGVLSLLDKLQLALEVVRPEAIPSDEAQRRLGHIDDEDLEEASEWLRLEEGLIRLEEQLAATVPVPINVDLGRRVVVIDSEEIGVTESESWFVHELVEAGPEQPMPGRRMNEKYPSRFPERIDRLKKKLDARILRWVGSSTAGYWLRNRPE